MKPKNLMTLLEFVRTHRMTVRDIRWYVRALHAAFKLDLAQLRLGIMVAESKRRGN